MREKLTFAGSIVLLVAIVAWVGCIAYYYGREFVEIFGLFHAALVIGGLVVVCRVADLVAPRRDGGSWFGVLCGFMIGDGDGDSDE